MSREDDAALTRAIRRRVDFLLCDDRIVRQMAMAEGVRPVVAATGSVIPVWCRNRYTAM